MATPANARLCHITKWDHFEGYGFNLHAEKGKPGQYIGKVDEGSPAEAAGLRQGDRILEVNGESITDKTHKQVVEAIKGLPSETRLLVVDPLEENGNGTETKIDGTIGANGSTPHPIDTKVNPSSKENGTGSLNLNMTAAELRAKLKERKKFDPKKQDIDFKKKFDIVQKL